MRKVAFQFAVCGLAVVLASGCATLLGGGPNPKALIMEQLEVWKAGMEAQDMDQVMTVYSPDFSHYEMGGFEDLKSVLQGYMDNGDLDNTVVSLDEVEIEVAEDGKATAYPIPLTAVFGTATIRLYFEEKDGVWLATSMDVEGV